MIPPDTPAKPRWKKRWVAAAVLLWLAVIYPASVGPALYLNARGWLPTMIAHGYVWPMEEVYELVDDVGDLYEDYVEWCEDAGERHAGPE